MRQQIHYQYHKNTSNQLGTKYGGDVIANARRSNLILSILYEKGKVKMRKSKKYWLHKEIEEYGEKGELKTKNNTVFNIERRMKAEYISTIYSSIIDYCCLKQYPEIGSRYIDV